MESFYATLAPYCTFTVTAILAKLLLLLSAIPAKANDAADIIAVTHAVSSYRVSSEPALSTAVVFHRRGLFRDRVTAVEVVQPAVVVQAPVVVEKKVMVTAPRTFVGVSVSGCANGSCGGSGVSVRRGFFRR